MRRFLALLVVIASTLLWNVVARAEETREIVRCAPDLLGAAAYSLSRVDPDDAPPYYRLQKTAPRLEGSDLGSLDVRYENVLMYGDTLIMTVNRGKSGYAHMYASGPTTLLDVNLFLGGAFNTDGPSLAYRCSRNDLGRSGFSE